MIKNLIFDWSGTISDDFDNCYIANMAIFRKLGIPEIPIDRFRTEFKLPYMEFYSKYTGASQEQIFNMYAEEIQKTPKPNLYPNVKDVLMKLKLGGVRMAVLSVNHIQNLQSEIEHFKLRAIFETVMGNLPDKTQSMKELIKKSGFHPDATAFVGDMVHDMQAGKTNKVKTIALTWGYNSKEVLMQHNPDHVIDDIKDLLSIVIPSQE